MPNKLKKRKIKQSHRTIKSLENNSRVIATKNKISTLKIVTNKPSIVCHAKNSY